MRGRGYDGSNKTIPQSSPWAGLYLDGNDGDGGGGDGNSDVARRLWWLFLSREEKKEEKEAIAVPLGSTQHFSFSNRFNCPRSPNLW